MDVWVVSKLALMYQRRHLVAMGRRPLTQEGEALPQDGQRPPLTEIDCGDDDLLHTLIH